MVVLKACSVKPAQGRGGAHRARDKLDGKFEGMALVVNYLAIKE